MCRRALESTVAIMAILLLLNLDRWAILGNFGSSSSACHDLSKTPSPSDTPFRGRTSCRRGLTENLREAEEPAPLLSRVSARTSTPGATKPFWGCVCPITRVRLRRSFSPIDTPFRGKLHAAADSLKAVVRSRNLSPLLACVNPKKPSFNPYARDIAHIRASDLVRSRRFRVIPSIPRLTFYPSARLILR